MARQNASIAPEFTHVRHYQYSGFYNGDGKFVPTRMTIVSTLEGNKVKYKVGFCSRNESNFNKKQGREAALQSNEVFEADHVDVEGGFVAIESAILEDLVKNRRDHMPFAHQKFAEMVAEQAIFNETVA